MDSSEQKVLQKHLSKFLIEDVFNTVTEEDILKINGLNKWEHKGKPLTPGQVNALRNEARALKDSGLWQILKAELLWLAHLNGYVKSQTESDQIAAKMLEYLANIIDTKLRKMSEM